MKITKKDVLKGLRFLISGGMGGIVSIFLILYLTEYKGIWYIYSLTIAFIPSCVVSFIFKKFWTFEDKSIEKIENQSFWYILLSISYLIISTTLIYVTVQFFHVPYILSFTVWVLVLARPDYIITNKIFPKQKTQ